MEITVMKTNRFNSVLNSTILSSAIALGLFASGGSAQAQQNPKLRANIPFAFQMGSKQMPAGSYDIYLLSNHLMLLRDRDPGKPVSYSLLVTPSEDGKIQTNGRLVFHRYGDRYFLREVWEANSKDGITCVPSAQEKEILRAQNQQAVSQTQVALNAQPAR
jgi:hypothetical protein